MKAEEDEKEKAAKAEIPPPAPENPPNVADEKALPDKDGSAANGPVSAPGSAQSPLIIPFCWDKCLLEVCTIISNMSPMLNALPSCRERRRRRVRQCMMSQPPSVLRQSLGCTAMETRSLTAPHQDSKLQQIQLLGKSQSR